jgi:hypothetical protein
VRHTQSTERETERPSEKAEDFMRIMIMWNNNNIKDDGDRWWGEIIIYGEIFASSV